jgi:hypothetical protein
VRGRTRIDECVQRAALHHDASARPA